MPHKTAKPESKMPKAGPPGKIRLAQTGSMPKHQGCAPPKPKKGGK